MGILYSHNEICALMSMLSGVDVRKFLPLLPLRKLNVE